MYQYRQPSQFSMSIEEMIIDNFAGGGGASTGIEAALGRSVDVAINHDPDSIAMHKINHPTTKHHCENVWDVDPREVANGNGVALAWFSPDCRHFSKAKGGKPVDKNVRGLAWLAVRYAATVRPRVICLENVEEFLGWGPVVDGRPDKSRKGNTFNSFVNALKNNGYVVDWKILTASDYGVPTSRRRLFLVARCDDQPIQWPIPTHGDPKAPGFQKSRLKPWVTAGEIIDWSIPCPSIFERKKPLAENTLSRIARGYKKFIADAEEGKPYIVRIGQTGHGGDRLVYPLDKPLTTVTTKTEHCLVVPKLVPVEDEGIFCAYVAKHYGGNYTGAGSSLGDPLHTITQTDHNAVVVAFLVKFYGTAVGQDLDSPLHTVTNKARFGLVTIKGARYRVVDIGMRMLEPHELFAAQGFPSDYIIDVDANGKKVPKYKQVARCGNSVPPPLAQALVEANNIEQIEQARVA
jgi:DNA (cytosine-5)-methyltransferase 1